MFIILAIFGVIMGISTSLFGFGGGFIAVPLLYHLLGTNSNPWVMHIAVATSTVILIANSLYATYKHSMKRNIIWRMVFPLILYIGIGASLGVFLTKFMNSNVIRWIFIVYLGYVILKSLTRKTVIHHITVELSDINKYLNFILGISIGVLSAMLGIGGSIMTVALMRYYGVRMKNAAAIATPLSFPVGIVGAIGYFVLAYTQHINLGKYYLGFIYWPALLILILGGFIGIPIGLKLINKIPDIVYEKVYVLFLTIVLIAMLV